MEIAFLHALARYSFCYKCICKYIFPHAQFCKKIFYADYLLLFRLRFVSWGGREDGRLTWILPGHEHLPSWPLSTANPQGRLRRLSLFHPHFLRLILLPPRMMHPLLNRKARAQQWPHLQHSPRRRQVHLLQPLEARPVEPAHIIWGVILPLKMVRNSMYTAKHSKGPFQVP